MKESRTTFSYLIEHMQEPSFQKVWDIAFDFVSKLPSDLCDELHESLNRGVDVLDSEPLLQMYIYAFGKMHNAKLQYAFNHLHKNALKYNEIEIVDYGCGQGLATICYHDFLFENRIEQKVKRIILLEPSSMALSRAELLCSRFYPDTEIIAVNKPFDNLTNNDLKISPDIPTIHLLSNILDIESYDLPHFSQFVKEQSVGDNEYVIVSPLQNVRRTNRLKLFSSTIEKNIYFEQYLDKRQLDSEKDWTCAVLLCSQKNTIEYDCNEVFEEAKSFTEKGEKVQDENYCRELFHKLQACATYGDKRCQNMLGIWYQQGIVNKPNYQLAIEWYKKSAEQDYESAFFNLGELYSNGEGVNKDLKKAVEYYILGANHNSLDCIYNLACCYFSGEGVEEDKEKAFSLFEEASTLNDPFAKYELYKCYINGWGTKEDEKLALKVLNEAAKLKHPKSCYILATYYYSGELVGKNERKAFGLIKESAELGYCQAQEKLGEIYRKGVCGKDESPKLAFKWYYKAAEQGSVSAIFYIGYFYANGYGVKKDANLAFEWYSRAAKGNSPAALNNLAFCYEYGKGTTVDLKKAILYYEKAAKLGSTTAQKNLAICYKNGTGVDANSQKVFYWTLEAAKRSDLKSQKTIALYYLKGYETDRSNEKSLIWYANYYFRINLSDAKQAYKSFLEKAEQDDAQSIYIIGKCLQYGVATEKNMAEAHSRFVKAAKLGHIESLIKVKQMSALHDFCFIKEDKTSIKDSYGVTYSKDKKILITTGYLKAEEYKIAEGTRIICDNAFYYASVKKVIIPSSVLVIGKNPFSGYEDGWGDRYNIDNIVNRSCNYIVSNFALYTKNRKKLISYIGDDSIFTIPQCVEVIGERAFADRFKLEEISFPDGLRCIENEAFIHCTKISRIDLPNSITSIGTRCFYGCANLSEVLSLGTISIVKEGTFMGCNIMKLALPTSLVELENDAFNSNNKLKSVVLPDSVRIIGNSCFAYCGISSMALNDNLKRIGDFCFFKCSIERLTIPAQVNSIGINPFIGTKTIVCTSNGKYVAENGMLYDKENGSVIAHYEDSEIALYPPICRINSYAFYNSSVTDVFMGANIIEIEPWAFFEADKLENLIWQKCKIKEIPEGCFGKCMSLCKISIPESVEEVQKGSFFDCFELRKIRFEGKETKANEKMFERIKRSLDIPNPYEAPYQFMGSTISEYFGREDMDFESFTKIEISIPCGCFDNLKFDTIYDDDLHNEHSSYGYGMDRTFIVKEYEKE